MRTILKIKHYGFIPGFEIHIFHILICLNQINGIHDK